MVHTLTQINKLNVEYDSTRLVQDNRLIVFLPVGAGQWPLASEMLLNIPEAPKRDLATTRLLPYRHSHVTWS